LAKPKPGDEPLPFPRAKDSPLDAPIAARGVMRSAATTSIAAELSQLLAHMVDPIRKRAKKVCPATDGQIPSGLAWREKALYHCHHRR
jgi:hypothetical protein